MIHVSVLIAGMIWPEIGRCAGLLRLKRPNDAQQSLLSRRSVRYVKRQRHPPPARAALPKKSAKHRQFPVADAQPPRKMCTPPSPIIANEGTVRLLKIKRIAVGDRTSLLGSCVSATADFRLKRERKPPAFLCKAGARNGALWGALGYLGSVGSLVVIDE